MFLNPCQAPEVLLGQERPTLFSDIWAVSAAILQWLTEYPPWNMQDLCERYRFRENRQLYALQVINVTDDSDRTTSVPSSILRLKVDKGQGLWSGILV